VLGVAYGGWGPSKGGGCSRMSFEVWASSRSGKEWRGQKCGRGNWAVMGRYWHKWKCCGYRWVELIFNPGKQVVLEPGTSIKLKINRTVGAGLLESEFI